MTIAVGFSWRSSLRRPGTVALAILLAALSLAEHIGWRLEIDALRDLLNAAGVGQGIAADVARQVDPAGARLRAARGLLAAELDPGTFTELAPGERRTRAAAGLPNLERAEALARSAVARRPAAWQGYLIAGAAAFLARSRAQDPRLAANRDFWEAPLLHASRLAPAQPEPARFLAAAYLNEWSRLGPDRRRAALPAIRDALANPPTLELLLETWIRLAPSLETALAVVPDTSRAWSRVAAFFATREDWERYCLAQERRERARLREGELAIEEAARLIRAWDERRARTLLLTTLDGMPIRAPYDALLEAVMKTLPPGPVSAASAARLEAWLGWATDRCLSGSCVLQPQTIERIAGLAAPETAPARAEAALLSGDLPAAERLERRSFEPLTEAWSTYALLKALVLAERGQEQKARDALDLVSPSWRERGEYRLARVRAGLQADRIVELPTPWTRTPRRWEAILPQASAGTVIVLAASSDSAGGPVEVLWNGELLGYVRVLGGTRRLLTPPIWLPVNRLSVLELEGRSLRLEPIALRPPA
jgi:hypothetical protein